MNILFENLFYNVLLYCFTSKYFIYALKYENQIIQFNCKYLNFK